VREETQTDHAAVVTHAAANLLTSSTGQLYCEPPIFITPALATVLNTRACLLDEGIDLEGFPFFKVARVFFVSLDFAVKM